MFNRPFSVYSDCLGSLRSVETYDLLTESNSRKLETFRIQASESDLNSDIKETLLNAPKMLPFAAEKYNISPNIKDYVLCCVVVLPSDLPNKNGIAFPHNELSSFCSDAGRLTYDTFTYRPVHLEHNNKDPSIAKGIVLSSHYKKMQGFKGNLWKTICLAAVDRTRDTALAKKIIDENDTGFSLGVLCSDYKCSITGNLFSSGTAENYTELRKPTFNIVAGKLAFLNAVDSCAFELSCVAAPAFVSAVSGPNNKILMR